MTFCPPCTLLHKELAGEEEMEQLSSISGVENTGRPYTMVSIFRLGSFAFTEILINIFALSSLLDGVMQRSLLAQILSSEAY